VAALLGCGGPTGHGDWPSRAPSEQVSGPRADDTAAAAALAGPEEPPAPAPSGKRDDAPKKPAPRPPAGKRVGPEDVKPVVIGNLRLEALHWGKERGLGQNGGYVAAFDKASGKELWVLKVYDVTYDPRLEEDVQDVFIESLEKSASGDLLEVRDERGRRYTVDPKTRTVKRR
jgi:hypothetical protein